MKTILIGLMAFISLSFVGCEDYHHKTNLLPLRQLVKDETKVKSLSGSYFLIGGSISASEHTVQKIKMYVLVDGSYSYQEFSLSDIKIRIDNSVDVPYLIVTYNSEFEKAYSDSDVLDYGWLHSKKTVLVCSEKYLPEKLLEIGI